MNGNETKLLSQEIADIKNRESEYTTEEICNMIKEIMGTSK